MRIHLQSPADDPLFDFSEAQWQAALARVSNPADDHNVTIGSTADDFTRAMADAEALICDASVIKARFPCPAPRLKLLFLTNAGLDRLAPFDWLPPDVILMNNRGVHAAKAGEFGIMSVLMLANRIPQMVTHQRAGQWRKLWGAVLAGQAITIVGLGALGGSVARHAAAFGMSVTGVRTTATAHPHCARVVATNDLDSVLPGTRLLLLACPLIAATRGLMDGRRLAIASEGCRRREHRPRRIARPERAVRSAGLGSPVRRGAGCVRAGTHPARGPAVDDTQPDHQSAHFRRRSRRPITRTASICFSTTSRPGETEGQCPTASISNAAIEPAWPNSNDHAPGIAPPGPCRATTPSHASPGVVMRRRFIHIILWSSEGFPLTHPDQPSTDSD